MSIQIYGEVLAVIFISMVVVFTVAQFLQNNSIVDIFWGLGFVSIVLWFLFFKQISLSLLDLAVLLWGLRLSAYLFIRNWGKGEDWRYQNFRKAWGAHPVIGAFIQVFMLQGVIMFIVVLPIIQDIVFPKEVNYITYLGLVIWLAGFCFETVADTQLYRYKQHAGNKGKIMRYGLWSLCRHPNYFGEILVWWGIWLMSINLAHPLITIISCCSPLMITWLLTRVSGVPMLEKKYVSNPEYEAYVKNTPAVFPSFSRTKRDNA